MALAKPLKYSAIAAFMAVFGILFGWVIFPAILKSMLKKEMALTKKTDIRKMWEKLPFALDFKIYLFNYTNPEEVQKGGIPIVKEVGPYHFEEWKEKVEIEDHDEDDTITYKRLDSFYFRPELSGPGLTGDEILTIPHMFMLGTIGVIFREKPAMLSVIGKALNGLFDNPQDLFMRAKALDIMFHGVIINCNKTEFAPKALCSQLKKDVPASMILEPNSQFRFSLFGVKNNTVDPKIITVKRGKSNVMEVGKVVAINGEPQQKIWRDTCNEFVGTDNSVFPPFLKETDRLQTFFIDLCRPYQPRYQKRTYYRGIKTNHYVTSIGDLANDPELQCFCDSPDKCPPKGLMDMYKCLGAPLYISMPHFFDSDPKLLEKIKGLHPDVDQHGIEIDFEPISGTPMVAKQRVQFNIQLLNTAKIDLNKDLSGDIIPIFWVEESLALNKTFVKMLKHQLFLPKRMVNILRWWLVSFGTFGTFVGIVYHHRDHIMKITKSGDKVSKISPVEGEAAKVKDEDGKNISVIGQPPEPPKVDM